MSQAVPEDDGSVESLRRRLLAVEAEAAEIQGRLAYLATASAALGASLDVGATLATLGNLVVPRLADWLTVHLFEGGEGSGATTLRPASVVHLDPAKAAAAREWESLHPPSTDDASGPGAVARTGRAERVAPTDPRVRGREPGLVVPLTVGGRTLGALTLAADRGLESTDAVMVEELAWRAAVAIENARLHNRAEQSQTRLAYQATLLRSQTEASLDGLLVVSPKGDVLEWNRRLTELLGVADQELTGGTIESVCAHALRGVANPDAFMARVQYLATRPADSARDEIAMTDGRMLDRYAAPLISEDGTYHGRAWYFRDITEQKRWEDALFESGERFAALARTLQQSLLPPDLPDVPFVEMAARYRPARGGMEMGGDFYDVFQTGRSSWAVVMGDVCGKGSEAARITGLARYTVRAGAMQTNAPSDVLRVLNEALLRQETTGQAEGERFATAAYAALRPAAGRIRLGLALGGHPRPLVVRAAGRVEHVGEPGAALGLFPDPSLADREIVLRAGDLAVFFTDGVTEARSPDGGEFGEERLRELLGSLAGATADEVAAAVEGEALAFGRGVAADDIAVLVVRVPLP